MSRTTLTASKPIILCPKPADPYPKTLTGRSPTVLNRTAQLYETASDPPARGGSGTFVSKPQVTPRPQIRMLICIF